LFKDIKIKFVTLNIWYGGRLFDSVASFIKKEDPDILVLQEVYDGKNPKLEKRLRTMDAFKKELGFLNYTFAPAFLDTLPAGNIDNGNAIFSKFPITNEKVTFLDKPYGRFNSEDVKDFGLIPPILQHGVIKPYDLKLNVFNIHGIWGLDGKDNKRRLKMSKIIVEQIKDKENVILAGDFNLQPKTKTIKNIEKYLVNVFKNELKTTFNMKHKNLGGYATAVVDMIFVSRNIEIVDHYCPQVDISDHLPLVCTFKL